MLAAVAITESIGRTIVNAANRGNDSYEISLNTQRAANVEVHIESANPILRAGTSMTDTSDVVVVTPINWATSQRVYVYGIADNASTGNQTASLTHSIVTAAPEYAGVTARSVSVLVIDTDSQPNRFE